MIVGFSQLTVRAVAAASLSVFLSGFAWAQTGLTLTQVRTVENETAFVTEFVFNKPFSGASLPIDFINQTVQLNLADVKLAEPTKKTNIFTDGPISRVVTFNFGQGVRSQIVLKAGLTAKQMESRVQVAKRKNTLQVSVLKQSDTVTKSLPVLAPVTAESEELPELPKASLRVTAQPASEINPFDQQLTQHTQSASLNQSVAPTQLPSTTLNASAAALDANPENQPLQSLPEISPEKASNEAVLTGEEPSEKDIPVFAPETPKTSANQPFQKMMIALAIVTVMSLGLIWGLRRYSRRNNNQVEATKIKVLSQHHLGPKKSLAIIRVAGESILIGVTDHNISLIKGLSYLDEELPEELPATPFHSALKSSVRQVEEPPSFQIPAGPGVQQEEPEEFAIKGLGEIKTLVSRKLKNMREI